MPRSPMTASERSECLGLYATGTTLDELSEKYDRHRCTIEALIRRSNIHRGHSLRKRGKRTFRFNWERELNG